jgi:hypothetical protein
MRVLKSICALLLVAAFAFCDCNLGLAQTGDIVIEVIDKKTKEPLAARIHLKDSKGRTVKPPKTVFWHDHFVFDGAIALKLRPGEYTYELECGPEYKLAVGGFKIEKTTNDATTPIEMERFVDMQKEGWWSGDLHVHRPIADIPLLMKAEDLRVAPVITWWNDQNTWEKKKPPESLTNEPQPKHWSHLMAGEDEREGGALLFFGLKEPLPIQGLDRHYPSATAVGLLARKRGEVHIDGEKPFWWEFPIWVAHGVIDSVGVANNHQHRDGMLDNEAWGKPRDKDIYPLKTDNGAWSMDIYNRMLNCGIRLPPSAGSASGVLPNPVGYNRVYVHGDPFGEKLDEFSYDSWWKGLKEGRVIVTNGPMLRPKFNGHFPGRVFKAQAGDEIVIETTADLATRDKVVYFELIKNGKVDSTVQLGKWVEQGGKLPKLTFKESGWMSVRVVTDNQKTYRFAMSGPVYVEIGDQQRISKSASQFFLDWCQEAKTKIKIPDEKQLANTTAIYDKAIAFWEDKVASANAD